MEEQSDAQLAEAAMQAKEEQGDKPYTTLEELMTKYDIQLEPQEAWCQCCGHEVPEDEMHWRGQFCTICTRDCGWTEDEL